MSLNRLIILTLLGVCSLANSWIIVDRPQSGLLERTWPAVGALNSGFLQFGGAHDDLTTNNYTFYNDLHFFSNVLQRYVKLEPTGPLPSVRAFSSGVSDPVSECLYIYGGSQYPPALFPVTVYDDFWVYCVEDNEWTQLAPRNQGPGARTGASLVLKGNRIYLFGGLDAMFQGHNDVWEYNIRSNRWTLLVPANLTAPLPTPQHLAVFQLYQGNLYAGYGERGVENGFGFATGLWKFDIDARTWTLLAPMPDLNPTRNYLANVLYNGYIICLGGDTPTNDPPCCGAPFPQNPTNQTVIYSIAENSWTTVNSPLNGIPNIKRHRLVLTNNNVHAVGGWGWVRNVGQVWNPNVYLASAPLLVARS